MPLAESQFADEYPSDAEGEAVARELEAAAAASTLAWPPRVVPSAPSAFGSSLPGAPGASQQQSSAMPTSAAACGAPAFAWPLPVAPGASPAESAARQQLATAPTSVVPCLGAGLGLPAPELASARFAPGVAQPQSSAALASAAAGGKPGHVRQLLVAPGQPIAAGVAWQQLPAAPAVATQPSPSRKRRQPSPAAELDEGQPPKRKRIRTKQAPPSVSLTVRDAALGEEAIAELDLGKENLDAKRSTYLETFPHTFRKDLVAPETLSKREVLDKLLDSMRRPV